MSGLASSAARLLAQHFELGRGGSGSNLRPMEGLRGFAVFLVFLVHFATLVEPWIRKHPALYAFAGGVHEMGNTGVDLFFVLSGYLIYGSLIARPQPFLAFMARRVRRIYPAFTAVFVAYIGLSMVFPTESKIPAQTTDALWYLVQNFLLLPGMLDIAPMITVAWSLSYEMFFYLAVPAMIALFGLRRRSSGQRMALLVLLSALIVAGFVRWGGHIQLVMFLSGALLYEVMQRHRQVAPASWHGALALAAGLLVTLAVLPGHGGRAVESMVLFVAFFVLCLTCFRNPGGWLARAFSWTPLRWLGNMSYSYYLLHGLALKAGFLVLSLLVPTSANGHLVFWLGLAPLFVLTLLASAVLFVVIERPLSLATARQQSARIPVDAQARP